MEYSGAVPVMRNIPHFCVPGIENRIPKKIKPDRRATMVQCSLWSFLLSLCSLLIISSLNQKAPKSSASSTPQSPALLLPDYTANCSQVSRYQMCMPPSKWAFWRPQPSSGGLSSCSRSSSPECIHQRLFIIPSCSAGCVRRAQDKPLVRRFSPWCLCADTHLPKLACKQSFAGQERNPFPSQL